MNGFGYRLVCAVCRCNSPIRRRQEDFYNPELAPPGWYPGIGLEGEDVCGDACLSTLLSSERTRKVSAGERLE